MHKGALLLLPILSSAFLFLIPEFSLVEAKQGCCSWHGGVSGCDTSTGRQVCNDGTYSPSCTCAYIPPAPKPTPKPIPVIIVTPKPSLKPTIVPTFQPVETLQPQVQNIVSPTKTTSDDSSGLIGLAAIVGIPLWIYRKKILGRKL